MYGLLVFLAAFGILNHANAGGLQNNQNIIETLVSIEDKSGHKICSGMLVQDDIVLTTPTCLKDVNNQPIIKIGCRKEDYVLKNSKIGDTLALVKINQANSDHKIHDLNKEGCTAENQAIFNNLFYVHNADSNFSSVECSKKFNYKLFLPKNSHKYYCIYTGDIQDGSALIKANEVVGILERSFHYVKIFKDIKHQDFQKWLESAIQELNKADCNS